MLTNFKRWIRFSTFFVRFIILCITRVKCLFYSRRKRIIGRGERNNRGHPSVSFRWSLESPTLVSRSGCNLTVTICIIGRHRNIPRWSNSTTIVIDKESVYTLVSSHNRSNSRKAVEKREKRPSCCSFLSASFDKVKRSKLFDLHRLSIAESLSLILMDSLTNSLALKGPTFPQNTKKRRCEFLIFHSKI